MNEILSKLSRLHSRRGSLWREVKSRKGRSMVSSGSVYFSRMVLS